MSEKKTLKVCMRQRKAARLWRMVNMNLLMFTFVCMHYAELSGAQHRRRGKQPHYLRVWTRAGQTGARDTFHAILDCFMAEFVARRMAGAGDTAQEPGAVTWPVTGVTLTLQCRWRIKRTLLLELCCPRDNNKVNFSHLSSL